VQGLFLLEAAECVKILLALCIKLVSDVVHCGGTGSFQFGESGIHIGLVGV
jgi:hypothetical protein